MNKDKGVTLTDTLAFYVGYALTAQLIPDIWARLFPKALLILLHLSLLTQISKVAYDCIVMWVWFFLLSTAIARHIKQQNSGNNKQQPNSAADYQQFDSSKFVKAVKRAQLFLHIRSLGFTKLTDLWCDALGIILYDYFPSKEFVGGTEAWGYQNERIDAILRFTKKCKSGDFQTTEYQASKDNKTLFIRRTALPHINADWDPNLTEERSVKLCDFLIFLATRSWALVRWSIRNYFT
jgi:hypothetical protein